MTPLDVSTPDHPARSQRGLWTTFYVDVSNNNGEVDWRRIARNARRTGITGAALKASEGTAFVDRFYAGSRATCSAVGLRTMAYHFARPEQNHGAAGALREAEHFCTVVGKIEPWEWRPMLDFETPPFDPDWVRVWNTHVRERLGVAPVLYSYWSALVGMKLREPLAAGLVLAYPNGQPRVAPSPPPWKHWTAHQYAWHGIVAGISGDADLNWTPSVRTLLAYPVRGAAYEPIMRRRRRRA